MTVNYPGESVEYRAARERLLKREVALRRAMEDVAAARRELPPGGAVPQDYVFRGVGPDGAEADVRLPELFAPGRDCSSSTTSCSPATRATTGRASPTARVPPASPCSTSSTARPCTPSSASTS